MIDILTWLAMLGCVPNASVVNDPTLDRPGRQEGAVIRVRTNDPGVWVHELWHVCQWQRLGEATTRDEWTRREQEAHTVELMWRQR